MLNKRSPFIYRPRAKKALFFLLIAALLIVAPGITSSPTRSVQATSGGAVSPETLLNPDGTLNLLTGFEGTLDLRGWEVTLDSKRGPVLKPASSTAAAGAGWHALPNQGLDNTVFALAVVGSDLYVAGLFTQTGDGAVSDLYNIARYDTVGGDWHALSSRGLNNTVYALVVSGSDLYVGGLFTETGNGSLTNLGYIARYDTTAGAWHALDSQGLSGGVHALAVSGSDLYVGGLFAKTGNGALTLGYVARYDTTAGAWHALSNQGLDNDVYALAVSGSDVYVGGRFGQTGDGSLTNLGRIARYDTTAAGSWHALSKQGLNSWVKTLLLVGSDLYVGGLFNQTGDLTLGLGYIARYDTVGGDWHALPKQGLNNYVFELMLAGNDVYVGGAFTQTGDGSLTNLGYIARYNTTAGSWNTLPKQGLDDCVRALAVVGSDVYMGGNFAQTGDGTLINLGHVAYYSAYRIYLPLVLKQ